jgi:hypothetical protein
MSKEEWTSVLKLATIWRMDKVSHEACSHVAYIHYWLILILKHQVRDLSIVHLSTLELSAIEKIQYAREYHVSAWLKEGVGAIASDLDNHNVEALGNTLGWKTTALILSLRAKAQPKVPTNAEEHQVTLKDWWCAYCLLPGVSVERKEATNSHNILFWASCVSCKRILLCAAGVHSAADGRQGSVDLGIVIPQESVSQVFAEEIIALEAVVSP